MRTPTPVVFHPGAPAASLGRDYAVRVNAGARPRGSRRKVGRTCEDHPRAAPRRSHAGRLLDATLDDLGAGLGWQEIYRPAQPAPLTCRGCGGRVHAKVSPRGLRFLAHHRRTPDCPLNGETPAHRLLESALTAAIRSAA